MLVKSITGWLCAGLGESLDHEHVGGVLEALHVRKRVDAGHLVYNEVEGTTCGSFSISESGFTLCFSAKNV